jgi:hypothetical protein
MKCQEDFLLTVAPAAACVDWTAIVWQAPTINQDGNGVAMAIGFQNQASASALAPDPSSGDDASATIIGTVVYNGPACNATVHTVITQTGSDPTFTKCTFQILIGFTPIVQVFQNSLGVVDTPFTVPDTGGVPKTLTISLDARAVPFFTFPSDPQEIDLSATITNV